MRTTLILKAELLTTPELRLNAIAAAVVNATAELERDIKENIQRSVPAGRTYRRTAIVRRGSRNNSTLKLARRGNRVVVGYNFHRASRAGQAPAIDSGRLINSIRGRRVNTYHGQINVGAAYGVALDARDGLDRPFFASRVDLYRPRFAEKIRRAALGTK